MCGRDDHPPYDEIYPPWDSSRVAPRHVPAPEGVDSVCEAEPRTTEAGAPLADFIERHEAARRLGEELHLINPPPPPDPDDAAAVEDFLSSVGLR